MNFTGSSKPLLLIHSAMPIVHNTIEYDIMLSPQFYTLKREKLPLRYRYQAKKLAPSVLDNLLPPGQDYEYYVFKDDDEWVFVAYDAQEIVSFLRSKGLGVEHISKLYFAEQVAREFTPAIKLDEQRALSFIQGSATVTPTSLLAADTRYQDFSDDFRPAEGVSFASGRSGFIARREAWIISAIFVAFSFMFFVEGARYQQVISSLEQETTELLKDYPALQSQYARENIAKKYLKIDKEERRKREVLMGLSKLMLPNTQIENLVMDTKHFASTLKSPDEKTLLRIKALAKARRYKTSRLGGNNLLKIEGSL